MEQPKPARSGHVLVDGHAYYWEFFGDGSREAICLLNGLAMSTRSWHSFLPLVHPEFDVILFDYCGQGNSYSGDTPYSIPEFCRALASIVDGLSIARFHVMGISYGGFVALDFARLYQHRLLSITLSGILLTHEQLFEMYEEISLLFYRTRQMEIYAYYMYEKIFGESFVQKIGAKLPEMRQKLVDRYVEIPHCLTQLTLAQDRLFAELDKNLPAYRSIKTPTLIMAGAEDRVIPPPIQRKICEILPNTRFEIVEGSGHVVYLERSDIFFPTLKAFAKAKSVDFNVAAASS
jgi:3-oxoadipate enol-lactonase